MKRALVLFTMITLLTSGAAFASECCTKAKEKRYDFERDYKCSQLINKIRFQKDTLYNVLGLSPSQQAIKDEIEQRRLEGTKPYKTAFESEKQKLKTLAQNSYGSREFKKQNKVTKKAWKKLHKSHRKYDKEFMKILCSSQKTKYKEIVRLTKRDIRYCYLNRKSSEKNPYMNTFGRNDAKPLCEVCPKHNAHHFFNLKCKE